MATFNAPSFQPKKEKNPDDEYIKVFDKLRNLITNPEKGDKAKDALVGLILRHSDIADKLADVVSDPEAMEEAMTKYPYLTGYTGKNLAERAREVGSSSKKDILSRINDLEATYGRPSNSQPTMTPPASVGGPAPSMPNPVPSQPMAPASTPARTAAFPVNPASGQLIK